MTLPVRIRFDELAQHNLPRSSTAKFSEKWQNSIGDEDFLHRLVERWRSTGMSDEDEAMDGTPGLAEAIGLPGEAEPGAAMPANSLGAAREGASAGAMRRSTAAPGGAPAARPRREGDMPERRAVPGAQPGPAPAGQMRQRAPAATEEGRGASLRRTPAAAGAAPAAADASAGAGTALQSLRNRIMKRD